MPTLLSSRPGKNALGKTYSNELKTLMFESGHKILGALIRRFQDRAISRRFRFWRERAVRMRSIGARLPEYAHVCSKRLRRRSFIAWRRCAAVEGREKRRVVSVLRRWHRLVSISLSRSAIDENHQSRINAMRSACSSARAKSDILARRLVVTRGILLRSIVSKHANMPCAERTRNAFRRWKTIVGLERDKQRSVALVANKAAVAMERLRNINATQRAISIWTRAARRLRSAKQIEDSRATAHGLHAMLAAQQSQIEADCETLREETISWALRMVSIRASGEERKHQCCKGCN